MPLSVSIMWIHFHKYNIYDYISTPYIGWRIFQFLCPWSFLSEDPNLWDTTPPRPLGHTAILKPRKTTTRSPETESRLKYQHQHLKLYHIHGCTQNLLTLVTLAYSASTLSFTLLTNHSVPLSSLPHSVSPGNCCGIFAKLISYDIYPTTSLHLFLHQRKKSFFEP